MQKTIELFEIGEVFTTSSKIITKKKLKNNIKLIVIVYKIFIVFLLFNRLF